ncbi:MAG: energy-coupling factor ABC transporter ATP-binding protein [Candidatus Methanomethylicaceae archaeon]
MKSIIEVRNVAYAYTGGINALSGISFEVMQGEMLGLLGPNGAGKSTLILLMAGLLKPNTGTIEIFGEDTSSKQFDPMRSKIGLVFQDPDDQLFNNTVFDDVAYGPRNLGLNEEEIEKRTEEILKTLGISHLANRSPYRLSLGEKKKVAIATALVLNPEILLLDEPTANLDPRSKVEIIRLLRDLNRQGVTIILATHDVEILPEVSERVILLNQGKIIGKGFTAEILQDEQLLKEISMETTLLTRLFLRLKAKGFLEEMPSNLEEAITILEKTILGQNTIN